MVDIKWHPDIKTLKWCFAVADDAIVGSELASFLETRWQIDKRSIPNNEVLGECAIEAVLFHLLNKAQEPIMVEPE